MPKMVQIRHVPDEIHARIKAKALQRDMTLSDYLLEEVRILAEESSWSDVFAKIDERKKPSLRTSSASAVRSERRNR